MTYDDLRENHDICAMTPWDPYWSFVCRGYVGISRGVASMFQGLTYDVFVPTYIATAGQKNQKRTGEMSISQDFSNWKYVEMSSVVI